MQSALLGVVIIVDIIVDSGDNCRVVIIVDYPSITYTILFYRMHVGFL